MRKRCEGSAEGKVDGEVVKSGDIKELGAFLIALKRSIDDDWEAEL